MKRLPVALSILAFALAACVPPGQPGADGSSVTSASGDVGSGSAAVPAPAAMRSDDDSDAGAAAQGAPVEYGRIGDTALNGYLALPSGNGAHPALVLIHEWWGLNDNTRDFARKFADQGYVALAVDLYDGQSTADGAQAQKLAAAVTGNMDRAKDNLSQAVHFLRNRADVNPAKIASVGWCFGGGWSYQMAKNDLGVKATVMYYGQFDPHDDFAHMKADILGHFGEKDTNIKVSDVRQFEAALKTHKGIHEVYIYPNAGHAFANEDNPLGTYDAAAAQLAWQRTLDFLQRTLK